MSDIEKTISDLKKIWKTYPDLRLGQLICNVIRDPALYYVADDTLINKLKMYYYGMDGD